MPWEPRNCKNKSVKSFAGHPVDKTHQGSLTLAQLEQWVGGRNIEDTKAKKYSQGKITHFLVKKKKEVAGGDENQKAI